MDFRASASRVLSRRTQPTDNVLLIVPPFFRLFLLLILVRQNHTKGSNEKESEKKTGEDLGAFTVVRVTRG